jgi:hypothetical protein
MSAPGLSTEIGVEITGPSRGRAPAFRDVERLLAGRGVAVSCETDRRRTKTPGPAIARTL